MAVNESEVIVIYVKNHGAFYVKYSRFMCVHNNLHAFFCGRMHPMGHKSINIITCVCYYYFFVYVLGREKWSA